MDTDHCGRSSLFFQKGPHSKRSRGMVFSAMDAGVAFRIPQRSSRDLFQFYGIKDALEYPHSHSNAGIQVQLFHYFVAPITISSMSNRADTRSSGKLLFLRSAATLYTTLRFLGAALQFVQKLPTLHPSSAAHRSTAMKYAAIHNFFGYP